MIIERPGARKMNAIERGIFESFCERLVLSENFSPELIATIEVEFQKSDKPTVARLIDMFKGTTAVETS